ncbi:hypothetical protein TWF696_007912 [Orbilia brochopaga]|uniref:Uncharacterized protein n=1 Tax=Orbilia brochopaga TaxID=3140254 RepID=A0AAV9UMI9_9PEZI
MPTPPDHEIFHDSFYAGHVNAVNKIISTLSYIEGWIVDQHSFLTEAEEILKDMSGRIKIIITNVNDEGVRLDDMRPHFQAILSALSLHHGKLKRRLPERRKEMATLKQELVAANIRQDQKLKVIMAELPKFYWGSSSPLKRILEVGEGITTQTKRLMMHVNNLAVVEDGQRTVEAGIWNCRQLLRKAEEQ